LRKVKGEADKMVAQIDGLNGTIEDLTVSADTKILPKAVRDMSDLTGVNSAELLENDVVVDHQPHPDRQPRPCHARQPRPFPVQNVVGAESVAERGGDILAGTRVVQ
jgi:hypothetical protein